MILALASCLGAVVYLWNLFHRTDDVTVRWTVSLLMGCSALLLSLYGFGVRGVGIADGIMKLFELWGSAA